MQFCLGFDTMNKYVNARIDGCTLTTSAGIIFVFFDSSVNHIMKQLYNREGSVVTGKSQISAPCIDFAIARSIKQRLCLIFSGKDLTWLIKWLFISFVFAGP